MTNTEATLKAASKALAKAIITIRQDDAELADRLARMLATEIQAYREAKVLDALAVEREAAMLAAA